MIGLVIGLIVGSVLTVLIAAVLGNKSDSARAIAVGDPSPTANDNSGGQASAIEQTKDSKELIQFAQCVKDSGAKFYGAFWCGHCKNQKEEFGKAAEELPYIECSTPDGKGQTQVCEEAGITGYPTWEFADGSRQSGELSFTVLENSTGCKLSTIK